MDNKEDKILLSQLEDRIDQCGERYMITHSNFLDLRQRSLAENAVRWKAGLRCGFYGGYEEAERVICVFLPEYIMEDTPEAHFAAEAEDDPLTVLRVGLKKGAPRLSHRDYLGSLMGLGIRREMTGDILVRDDGADVIVLKEIAEFIMANLGKAGRASLSIEEVPVSELMVPEVQREERFVSVASMRVDNIVNAAFGLSRTKAAEAIKSGLIFVNGMEVTKPDKQLEEGDKLVMRHKGKTVIKEVKGTSAKGRIQLTLIRYK